MGDDVHKIFPGPVLVLAGPGTGKTHTLALRIKWLVEEKKCPPDEISVITFTGEAARNMRARISNPEKKDVHIPKELQPSTIRTMHSLGHRIISENPTRCGLQEGFRVIPFNTRMLLEDAAQLLGFPRSMGEQAEKAKQQGNVSEAPSDIRSVISKYDEILRVCNAIDHDDQIYLACQLLRDDEELLAEYRKKALHLLVDEYQDINAAQFELIQLLCAETSTGLFVVGDDDQSIYGFRGGSPTYIRNFAAHFGESARVESLSLSRRCPANVLYSALAVVQDFSTGRRNKKPPTFESNSPGIVEIQDVPSDSKEAEMIAAITAKAAPSRKVLILVPQAPVSRLVRRELHRLRVPYEFRGSTEHRSFHIFPSLKMWLSDPTDNIACREVIQLIVDRGKIGVPSAISKKSERRQEREEALGKIAALWSPVLDRGQSLVDVLAHETKEKLIAEIKRLSDEIKVNFGTGVPEFSAAVCRILQPWKTSEAFLGEIVTLLDEVRGRSTGDASVRVMSMWRAKGLEADVTIILGLDEGLFPKLGEDVSESARLLFVSMTRAKSELYLFHTRRREGSTSFIKNSFNLKACSFLDVIPKDHCERKYVQSASAKAKKQRKRRG